MASGDTKFNFIPTGTVLAVSGGLDEVVTIKEKPATSTPTDKE